MLVRRWHAKAATAIIKNTVPGFDFARTLKRALVPYTTDGGNDAGLVRSVLEQVSALRHQGVEVAGKTVAEIGSGWVPMTPLLYRMAGAAKIITADVKKLMDRRTFGHAVRFIDGNLDAIADRAKFDIRPFERSRIVYEPSLPLPELLAANAIDYRVPFNFENLEDGSADIIVSHSVLEHIPTDVLSRLLARCRSILRPGGLMVHNIDLSDHFQQYDKSISRLNFLRYEDSLWKWTQLGSHLYMNRLRRFEYLDMFDDAGFKVLSATAGTRPDTTAELQTMPICSRYRNVPLDELAILSSTVVAATAR